MAASQQAACEPTCDAFYVGSTTRPEDIPEWVKDLTVYRDFKAAGLERNVMFYESEAAVGYPSSTRSTRTTKCPRRYACLYQHVGHRYSNGYFFGTRVVGFYYDLANYGMNNRVSSWRNMKTAHDAHMDSNEHPYVYCMPRRHSAYRIGSFNDKADKFENYATRDRVCPL